uniref:Alkylated DNA repair protein AlkB homologue 8 N-terminal domain-containing protein n=1 Tax=Oncorhynchus tshawytscha TaxID=74940 RepID=A0AAZ3PI03_ONCTS
NLRRLKKFGLSPKTLTNFYRCTIESILLGCIAAWYGNCSAHNRKALQRVVRSAQRITGGELPALQDTYTTRCHRKAIKIIKDNNHQSHCLFTPLSSRRRGPYRCIKAGTERLKNSFYLKAIRLLNSCQCTVSISSHFNIQKLDVIDVSLVTLNNATLYHVYIPYITHLICTYCTLHHLLHLACAARPSLIHIFICTYSYSFLYTCVYNVVVVKLLDYLLDVTVWSELEAQAFHYTRINICKPCVCDQKHLIGFDFTA